MRDKILSVITVLTVVLSCVLLVFCDNYFQVVGAVIFIASLVAPFVGKYSK